MLNCINMLNITNTQNIINTTDNPNTKQTRLMSIPICLNDFDTHAVLSFNKRDDVRRI